MSYQLKDVAWSLL